LSKPPLPTGIEYHALVQENVGFYAALLPPGAEHNSVILPAGDHRASDRIKDEAWRFIDASRAG
jgi:hypothetical protein